MSGSIDVDGVQVGYHGIKYRDARISQLEEALSELMDAVKKEVDDKPLLGVSAGLERVYRMRVMP